MPPVPEDASVEKAGAVGAGNEAQTVAISATAAPSVVGSTGTEGSSGSPAKRRSCFGIDRSLYYATI
jgi:hypothetical protein